MVQVAVRIDKVELPGESGAYNLSIRSSADHASINYGKDFVTMGVLGNLLWFIFGGILSGLSWCLAGVLWCITIIGIPVGLQCFKLSALSFFPFGKEVEYGGGAGSFLLNIIWLLVTGLPLAVEHLIFGFFLCVTIVGIPFGIQHFKLAKLALMPFGAKVR